MNIEVGSRRTKLKSEVRGGSALTTKQEFATLLRLYTSTSVFDNHYWLFIRS
jgi:hypothetical protein